MVARFGGFATDPGELAAVLRVDVDLAPLDQGLNQARRTTATALGDMGNSAERFSRQSRFAFQNAAFQVQDFVVQVSSGQGVLRAFAQQAPQLLGAFGPIGVVAGIAAAALGGLATAFLDVGSSAEDSADHLKQLEAALKTLAESYGTATDAAREYLGVQQDLAEAETGREITEQRQQAIENLSEALKDLNLFSLSEGLVAAGTGAKNLLEPIPELVTQFASGAIGIEEFRQQLQELSNQPGIPAVVRDRIRELGDAAVAAGALVENLNQKIDELTVAGKGRILGKEEFGPPKEPFEEERREAEKAEREEAARLKKTADALKAVADQTVNLRLQREALQAGGPGGVGSEASKQVQDLATAAARFGLTIEGLKEAPPNIREAVQALVEELAAIRDVEAAFKDQEQAAAKAQKQQIADTEKLLKANLDFIEELEKADQQARRRRGERLEAGGRLPDAIDAANTAAQELSTTLTSLDTLSFEGLNAALASITQQIAQAVIQALIFRAITSAIGGGLFGGGGFAATAAGGGGGATSLVGGIPQFQHGGVFSRGSRALMTGAVSGAALLEGAVDEAVMPLTRTRGGDLGVRMEGGTGAGNTYNITAERIDPGTVSALFNLSQRAAPGSVVNARARGLIRDQRAPF
jgi:hypothetical protein